MSIDQRTLQGAEDPTTALGHPESRPRVVLPHQAWKGVDPAGDRVKRLAFWRDYRQGTFHHHLGGEASKEVLAKAGQDFGDNLLGVVADEERDHLVMSATRALDENGDPDEDAQAELDELRALDDDDAVNDAREHLATYGQFLLRVFQSDSSTEGLVLDDAVAHNPESAQLVYHPDSNYRVPLYFVWRLETLERESKKYTRLRILDFVNWTLDKVICEEGKEAQATSWEPDPEVVSNDTGTVDTSETAVPGLGTTPDEAPLITQWRFNNPFGVTVFHGRTCKPEGSPALARGIKFQNAALFAELSKDSTLRFHGEPVTYMRVDANTKKDWTEHGSADYGVNPLVVQALREGKVTVPGADGKPVTLTEDDLINAGVDFSREGLNEVVAEEVGKLEGASLVHHRDAKRMDYAATASTTHTDPNAFPNLQEGGTAPAGPARREARAPFYKKMAGLIRVSKVALGPYYAKRLEVRQVPVTRVVVDFADPQTVDPTERAVILAEKAAWYASLGALPEGMAVHLLMQDGVEEATAKAWVEELAAQKAEADAQALALAQAGKVAPADPGAKDGQQQDKGGLKAVPGGQERSAAPPRQAKGGGNRG